jgi:hypothetical protein
MGAGGNIPVLTQAAITVNGLESLRIRLQRKTSTMFSNLFARKLAGAALC